MPKGPSYEREVAKQLSLWWTKGDRDDLCWRTANSGGRATVRGRKGKRTAGHAGDLGATDAAMLPFFRLVTVEAKRGYTAACSLHNLIDPPAKESKSDKAQNYPAFLRQTRRAARRAGTPYWMLVHRPDRKNAVVFLPMPAADVLLSSGFKRDIPAPWAVIVVSKTPILFMTLANFFETFTRKDFKRVASKQGV